MYNNYTNIYNKKERKNTKFSRNYRIRLVVSKPGTKSRFTKQHEFSPFVHFTFDAFLLIISYFMFIMIDVEIYVLIIS